MLYCTARINCPDQSGHREPAQIVIENVSCFPHCHECLTPEAPEECLCLAKGGFELKKQNQTLAAEENVKCTKQCNAAATGEVIQHDTECDCYTEYAIFSFKALQLR